MNTFFQTFSRSLVYLSVCSAVLLIGENSFAATKTQHAAAAKTKAEKAKVQKALTTAKIKAAKAQKAMNVARDKAIKTGDVYFAAKSKAEKASGKAKKAAEKNLLKAKKAHDMAEAAEQKIGHVFTEANEEVKNAEKAYASIK